MRKADEDGFRAFAQEQAPALRRSAYLFCGDWHLADDLMQTALIRIYQSWSRVRRREALHGYARKVLLNVWLDERRRPWRRSELRDGQVPDPADAAADPAAAELRAWSRDLVHRALLQLPPRQRATLVMRYFDELSVAETAEALGCSEGTVKSQTARALESMRGIVARLESGGAEAPVGRGAR